MASRSLIERKHEAESRKGFFMAREVRLVLSPTISNRRRAESAPGQVSAIFESSIMALYNLLIYFIAMAAFSLVILVIHSIVSTEESLTLHVLTLFRPKSACRVLSLQF